MTTQILCDDCRCREKSVGQQGEVRCLQQLTRIGIGRTHALTEGSKRQ